MPEPDICFQTAMSGFMWLVFVFCWCTLREEQDHKTHKTPIEVRNQQKILFHIYLSCEVGISISYIQFPTSQFRAINITFSFRTPTTSCLFIVEILLIVGKQNSTSASLCLDVETNNCISEQTFRCCWWTRK